MLVSAVAGIPFAARPALAGPARIGKITVKHVRLDWTPTRTSGQAASLNAQAAASASIPMFTASVRDGTSTFRYSMVGKNPFVAQTQPSTTVSTTLIPVVIKFSNGDTWNPAVIDSCDSQSALTRARNSPIFVAQPWKFGPTSVGTGQYIDAFQRGEFYRQTKPNGINPGYHVKLALKTHAALVLHVPTADAAESTTVCGNRKLGAVEINYLDGQIQHYITATLGSAATTTFPLFLLGNVVEYIGSTSNCCVLGYHNAIPNASQLQTYGVSMYDNTGDFGSIADTSILAHEVGEWMNDPIGTNPTKPWGNIGQVAGCQFNLEVGDPLTGTGITDTLNGKKYHLQELAFFSWFYHSSPSLGANGWFSSNGTFRTSAAPC
ncbi:MAG: hypothetical protein JWM72_2349 [Actinomycetia bacterium]|jgi:hypothetical protein|nr:hypothetical protein [Actinomycetes bacterium]MDQ1459691.1 hypothetical protein [Actinomycetota bacterium]